MRQKTNLKNIDISEVSNKNKYDEAIDVLSDFVDNYNGYIGGHKLEGRNYLYKLNDCEDRSYVDCINKLFDGCINGLFGADLNDYKIKHIIESLGVVFNNDDIIDDLEELGFNDFVRYKTHNDIVTSADYNTDKVLRREYIGISEEEPMNFLYKVEVIDSIVIDWFSIIAQGRRRYASIKNKINNNEIIKTDIDNYSSEIFNEDDSE